MKNALIIGNGFDMDLGLHTSYRSFIDSTYWPFPGYCPNPEASLRCALQHYCNSENWMDLETIIENYAKSRKDVRLVNKLADDRRTFNELQDALAVFLRVEQEKDINQDSMAFRLMRACQENGYFTCYSFNYTMPSKLPSRKSLDHHYVHGSLVDKRIILGVREEVDLQDGYEFLRKTFSRFYNSVDLPYALQDSKEVIFFGHSLSPNDYHYFDAFFESQSDPRLERSNAKYITFFTKDHESEIAIKKQLWTMNKKRTDRLFTHNQMAFIHTHDTDKYDVNLFEHLLSRLSKKSREKVERNRYSIH